MFTAFGGFFATDNSTPPAPAGNDFTAIVDMSKSGGTAGGMRVFINDFDINTAPVIDWGDGTNLAITSTGLKSKTYPSTTAQYTMKINANAKIGMRITDATKVIDIVNWGNTRFSNNQNFLNGAVNLSTISATDSPNLTECINMSNMFLGCTNLTIDYKNVNAPNVANAMRAFGNCTSLNGSFSNTTIGSLTSNLNATSMFQNCFALTGNGFSTTNIVATTAVNAFASCTVFNGNLAGMNWANLSNSTTMFSNCTSFTGQGMANLDVSKLAVSQGMFFNDSNFNGNLSGWNTANITSMGTMFNNCQSFTGTSITGWNTSNVTNMGSTFYRATAMNANLSGWNTTKVTNFVQTFREAGNPNIMGWRTTAAGAQMDSMFLNNTNFNQNLSGWCVSQIATEPASFSSGASSWTLAKPVWGTCPV